MDGYWAALLVGSGVLLGYGLGQAFLARQDRRERERRAPVYDEPDASA
jgi:hypothetical protein